MTEALQLVQDAQLRMVADYVLGLDSLMFQAEPGSQLADLELLLRDVMHPVHVLIGAAASGDDNCAPGSQTRDC